MDESKSGYNLDSVDDILAHYGVLGMHWGVRKNVSAPTAVVLQERHGKQRLKTSGGKDHLSTADAQRSATYKQQAKKNSTDALSDAQLKSLVNRMNMEQQYSDLTIKQKPAIQQFLSKLLLGTGKQQAQQAASTIAAKKVAKVLAVAAI